MGAWAGEISLLIPRVISLIGSYNVLGHLPCAGLDRVLYALIIYTYLSLKTTLQNEDYYTCEEEEKEAQKFKEHAQGHVAGNRHSGAFEPRSLQLLPSAPAPTPSGLSLAVSCAASHISQASVSSCVN